MLSLTICLPLKLHANKFQRDKRMNLLELRKKSLAVLLLALLSLVMLPGCSSSGDSSEDCKSDPDCVDQVF
jgi:hypothetical protein